MSVLKDKLIVIAIMLAILLPMPAAGYFFGLEGMILAFVAEMVCIVFGLTIVLLYDI
jgi:Na+-translocating ferredoxin:NAD+ oxidoreductase RnfD subunit